MAARSTPTQSSSRRGTGSAFPSFLTLLVRAKAGSSPCIDGSSRRTRLDSRSSACSSLARASSRSLNASPNGSPRSSPAAYPCPVAKRCGTPSTPAGSADRDASSRRPVDTRSSATATPTFDSWRETSSKPGGDGQPTRTGILLLGKRLPDAHGDQLFDEFSRKRCVDVETQRSRRLCIARQEIFQFREDRTAVRQVAEVILEGS